MKIVHLSSAHPRYDIRIFLKQCRSLVLRGYDVTLVVADSLGDETRDGVDIVDVGYLPGRLHRMFRTVRRVKDKAVQLDAEIYHLHDPELIPIGLKLKRLGKRVVFDAHEDVSKQMLGKPYLGPIRLRILSWVFSVFERFACIRLDGIVAATPAIGEKFLAINPNTVVINNYPLLAELDSGERWDTKCMEVSYVGEITRIRGIREIVSAMEELNSSIRLNLVGTFADADAEVEADVKSMPGWRRVKEFGFLDREGVREVLARSVAGLVTFHPLQNHVNAQPNKMFEYMSAGVPVIASHFPLWREIVEGENCGICVDPLSPTSIGKAIDYVAFNPAEAIRMGDNGRQAVLKRYNWSIEEQKLADFYTDVLGGR